VILKLAAATFLEDRGALHGVAGDKPLYPVPHPMFCFPTNLEAFH
jgi:hypothetical protein